MVHHPKRGQLRENKTAIGPEVQQISNDRSLLQGEKENLEHGNNNEKSCRQNSENQENQY